MKALTISLKTGHIVCTIIYGFNMCHAYAVPSLSDGVAMDSLIHVPAEDDVAKLHVQSMAEMSLKIHPNKWSMRL